MKINQILFIFFSTASIGLSQDLILDFQNCNINSPFGMGEIIGNSSCECGVLNDAYKFDGLTDGFSLDTQATTLLLNNDFTIDFYIDINNKGQDQVDILSITHKCGFDSLITLKFLPNLNVFLLELSNKNGEFYSIQGKKGPECWNRITIVKSGLNYLLYVNNVLAGKEIANQLIDLSKKAKISIANSPCTNTSNKKLNGRIDEFKIYSSALTQRNITTTYLYPDKIITKDTTIYLGSSVNIDFGNTCTTNFNWQPVTGLDDAASKNVVATPEITTTYSLMTQDQECQNTSKVTIFVLDLEKQNCENILLPSAFTPNGDNLNDIYKISNVFIIEKLQSFEILDRWGELIFTTSDKDEGWDGQYNGRKAEPATYVYRIKYTCKGEQFSKLNSFVLIK